MTREITRAEWDVLERAPITPGLDSPRVVEVARELVDRGLLKEGRAWSGMSGTQRRCYVVTSRGEGVLRAGWGVMSKAGGNDA